MRVTEQHISIILPISPDTLEHPILARWLRASIVSILAQTHEDFELLLVLPKDVRNTHPTLALLPQDSRIQFLNREDSGIVSALNTGIKAARGNWLARMDADDISHPERLSLQLDHLTRNETVDFSSTTVEIFSQDQPLAQGNRQYQQWLNETCSHDSITASLYIECPCPHPTWLFKRKVIDAIGGYRNTEWAEDYDFVLRAAQAGLRFGKPDSNHGALLSWRTHNSNLTRTDSRYKKINFIKAKAWALSCGLLRNRPAVIIGTGKNAKHMYDALNFYKVDVNFFVDLERTGKKNSLRNTPVISYSDIQKRHHGDALLVSVVTRYGARQQLRQWLDENKFIEQTHYIFAG